MRINKHGIWNDTTVWLGFYFINLQFINSSAVPTMGLKSTGNPCLFIKSGDRKCRLVSSMKIKLSRTLNWASKHASTHQAVSLFITCRSIK